MKITVKMCLSTAEHPKVPLYNDIAITYNDPPGIMFVKFFGKKYLPTMDKYIVENPPTTACR